MISNENLAKKNWQLKEYGLNLIGKKNKGGWNRKIKSIKNWFQTNK
jgi:hypothetical protein